MLTRIQASEEMLAEAKNNIEKAEVLSRLEKNPDFQRLISKGFMVEDCAVFAQLSQDPSIPAASQVDCLHLAQAAGHLKRYLQVIYMKATQARNDIPNLEELIENLRAEEDAE